MSIANSYGRVAVGFLTLVLCCLWLCGCWPGSRGSGVSGHAIVDHRTSVVSLKPYCRFENGGSGLGPGVMSKIGAHTSLFRPEGRDWCLDFFVSPIVLRFPWMNVGCPADIGVDSRFLNKFLLVFASPSSENVEAYVIQEVDVDSPSEDVVYVVFYQDIYSLIGDRDCDIYGFHNDSLVFKMWQYSLERMRPFQGN